MTIAVFIAKEPIMVALFSIRGADVSYQAQPLQPRKGTEVYPLVRVYRMLVVHYRQL